MLQQNIDLIFLFLVSSQETFYIAAVSLDKLFERDFDINDPDLFNKKYAVGTIIKERLAKIRMDMEAEQERIKQLLKDTEDLL